MQLSLSAWRGRKNLYFKKLTLAVLNDTVKAVYVHAPDKSSSHRVRDVETRYNYIDMLPTSLLSNLIGNCETSFLKNELGGLHVPRAKAEAGLYYNMSIFETESGRMAINTMIGL